MATGEDSSVRELVQRRVTDARPELWRYIFDALEDPVFVHDGEFRLVLANSAYCARAGVTEAEALGKPYWELFPRLTGPMPGCESATRGDGESSQEELRIGERVLTSRGYTVRDEHGAFLYAVHLLGDVTAQRESEAALDASRARFQQLSESLPLLAWTFTTAGRCDYLSPQWVAYTGIPESAQLDRAWLEQVHPDDREHVIRAWEAATASGTGVNTEVRIRRHDGVYRWFKTLGTPQHNSDGQVVKWYGTNTDIDDVKATEVALARSEERFRSAMDTARDAILIFDAESGVLSLWNTAAEQMFGYSKDELVGKPLDEHGPLPGVRAAARAATQPDNANGGGAGHISEQLARDKSGTDFAVELSLSVTQADGNTLVTGIARDIRGRKRAQAELLRANAMYRTISRANEELVRAASEGELLRAMCRVLTVEGGFHIVWVGEVAEDASQSIGVLAATGCENCAFDCLGPTGAEEDRLRSFGATFAAFRTQVPVVCNDVRVDPAREGERARAAQLAYVGVAAFPLHFNQHGRGVLTVYSAEPDAFTSGVIALLRELGNDLAFGVGNLRARADRTSMREQLEASLDQAVAAVASTVEMRDPYTAGHQRRVAVIATALAAELKFSPGQTRGLHLASVVHDIGKIHVPAEMLSNPNKLTDLEFALIKTHSEAGWEILKEITFPWPVAEIVRQHHERMDGSGYPRGLRGDEILPEARVLAVADVVEAMSSHRPYRTGLGILKALQELAHHKGTLYDAAVVDACHSLFLERNFEL